MNWKSPNGSGLQKRRGREINDLLKPFNIMWLNALCKLGNIIAMKDVCQVGGLH
jgi:hypothetical protein